MLVTLIFFLLFVDHSFGIESKFLFSTFFSVLNPGSCACQAPLSLRTCCLQQILEDCFSLIFYKFYRLILYISVSDSLKLTFVYDVRFRSGVTWSLLFRTGVRLTSQWVGEILEILIKTLGLIFNLGDDQDIGNLKCWTISVENEDGTISAHQ